MSLTPASNSLFRLAPRRATQLSNDVAIVDDTKPATASRMPAASVDTAAQNEKHVASGRPRVEVRRDVTDAGSIKVTVITYNDGTSDTLNEMVSQKLAKVPAAPLGKGMTINQLA